MLAYAPSFICHKVIQIALVFTIIISACIDSHFAHIWKNTTHVSKIAIKSNTVSDIAGLAQWTYAPQWKCFLIYTALHELKIVNSSLQSMSTTKSLSPVVRFIIINHSMLFVDDLLVLGCVGKILVWGFQRPNLATDGPIEFKEIALTINDFNDNDWVSHLAFNSKRYNLYAASENSVSVSRNFYIRFTISNREEGSLNSITYMVLPYLP